MVRGNAGSWRTRVPSSDGTGSSSAVAAQGSTGIPNIPQRTSAYRPTKMWSNQNNDDANRAAVRPRRNTNYRGDPNSEYFTQHVIGLEDEANSALWIMDIPTSVKATDLFSIVHVGAVSYLNLHKPETEDGKCAADLAFKQPEHAARFYSQIKSGLFLHGGQLWGRYNRNGLLGHNGPQRRVIWIRAPEDIMTEEYWRGYFDLYCVNRVVGVRSEPVVKGQKLMEFEFVRIAGQAQSCLQAILNDEELIEKGVSAGYSRDPCEA
ncbi:hypothetical protein B0J14DRAFT_541259 [Halenospora varia]|nr:hypothetical protein B0J14DRAFT_541259 [Halenospora varia]